MYTDKARAPLIIICECFANYYSAKGLKSQHGSMDAEAIDLSYILQDMQTSFFVSTREDTGYFIALS